MKGKFSASVAVCVLAGGLNTRMGRDKAFLWLGRRRMIDHIRSTAKRLGLPLRVLRQDLVLRCGPVGGVCTALRTTRVDAELFLACDMPFVSVEFLRQLIADFRVHQKPIFAATGTGVGFPFLLPQKSLNAVERQLQKREFSIQRLAKRLQARSTEPPLLVGKQLFNINTPHDLRWARRQWMRTYSAASRKP